MSDGGERSRSGGRSPSVTLSQAAAGDREPSQAAASEEKRSKRRSATRDIVPGSHRDSAPAPDAVVPTRGRPDVLAAARQLLREQAL